MPYTYSQFKTKVSEILQDDAAKLTTTERDGFIQEAIKLYSKHRPRLVIKDITGDGTYDYLIATYLASWIKDFSVIKSIEYPADERDPVYLDEDDFMIFEKETGQYIRFLEDTPLATEKARIAYTALHILNDTLIDDCEDAWNEYVSPNVTSELDTTGLFKVGAGAIKLSVGAGAGVEILATEVISVASLANYTHIGMWVNSSKELNANDLQLLLDDTAACASPLETLNIPAIPLREWIWIEIPLSNPGLDINLISIGIKQRVDKGVFILWIDDIRATQNTIPAIDEDAVCNLAASLCSGALASTYAHTSDSTVTADSVDHQSKSREFASRAREQKKIYMDHLGLKDGEVAPASAVKSMNADYPWGEDRLTHPKKWR